MDLRRRLFLAILGPLMIVLALSVFLDYRLAKATADAAFDQSLADAALDIAAHIQKTGSEATVQLSVEAEAMLRSDALDTIYFAVRDESGGLLAGDDDLPDVRVGGGSPPEFIDLLFREVGVRAAVHRMATPQGQINIVVAETLMRRTTASRKILTAMAFPNLVVVLAAFLAVYVGVDKAMAPLERIENEIAARSPRDLRRIDSTGAPREVRPMFSRLNELFELLRAAAAAQQRFLADAAHQLRTPLAGLQTQIELATSAGCFAADAERISRIDEAIRRIEHLVSQLLTYARADPATAVTQVTESVSLSLLAEETASFFFDSALAKGIDLGFEIEQATISGIPWMLREALSNLIDNALRYAPANGEVTVRSGRRAQFAFLEVEDSGPGIPLVEREHVFERFYRIRGTQGEGCGLGLAIVREIVELHGGGIELADRPPQGTRVTLLFALPSG